MASIKKVVVGGVTIGGGAPVSIQSMCDAPAADWKKVVAQVRELAAAGCEIVRIAVPDMECVEAAKKIRKQTVGVPLVADVHFDHRVAIALCGVVDKIRLNPGTLRTGTATMEVARALLDTGTPVRVGANSGSLPADLRRGDIEPPEALVEAATRQVDTLGSLGVTDMVVSVKSSCPVTTLKACELAAERFDLPLHVGVTESGTTLFGAVRSAAVVGSLLSRGIGDTIRVSLAGPPLPEVAVAREILAATGHRKPGITVTACPGCGRRRMRTGPVAEMIESALTGTLNHDTSYRIAVMGCEVNGPGEAGNADIAIVGTVSGAALYRKGVVIMTGSVQETTDRAIEIASGDMTD